MDRAPTLRVRRAAFDHGTALPGTTQFTVDTLQRLALAAQVRTRSVGLVGDRDRPEGGTLS